MRRFQAIAITAALVLLAASCNSDNSSNDNAGTTKTDVTGSGSNGQSDLPQGSESVKLDPEDFTTSIDNPYWPMTPGDRREYRVTDAGTKRCTAPHGPSGAPVPERACV
jgi:hypothetical protein